MPSRTMHSAIKCVSKVMTVRFACRGHSLSEGDVVEFCDPRMADTWIDNCNVLVVKPAEGFALDGSNNPQPSVLQKMRVVGPVWHAAEPDENGITYGEAVLFGKALVKVVGPVSMGDWLEVSEDSACAKRMTEYTVDKPGTGFAISKGSVANEEYNNIMAIVVPWRNGRNV